MTAFRVAFLVALAAAIVLLVAPLYESGETLVQANGSGMLALILAPLVLAGLPLVCPDRLRGKVAVTVGGLLVLTSFVSSAGPKPIRPSNRRTITNPSVRTTTTPACQATIRACSHPEG